MPQISTQLVPVTYVGTSSGSVGRKKIMRPRLVKIGTRYVFPYAGTTGTIITNFGAMTDSEIADMNKGSVVASNNDTFPIVGHIISAGTSNASISTKSIPYNFGIPTVINRTYFGNSTAYHSVVKNPTKYCNVSFIYNNVNTTIGSFSGYLPGGYLIDTSRPMVSFEIHVFTNLTNSYNTNAPDVYIGRIDASGNGSNKKLDNVGSDSIFRHYYWRSSGASRFVSLPIVIIPNTDSYRARVHWCYLFKSSVT